MKHFKIMPSALLTGELDDLGTDLLNFNSYLLTVAFRENEYCLLSTLQLRFDSKSEWKIVTNSLGSYTGEITVELGVFDPESVLQLFWEINAPLTKISAIAMYVINKDTKKAKKVKPVSGVHSIEKGGDWTDEQLDITLNF